MSNQEVQALQDTDPQMRMLSISTGALKRKIEELPAELLQLTEEELADRMPTKQFTITDSRIRIAFWDEYRSAIQQGREMKASLIYGGLTSCGSFSNLCSDKVRLAYYLLPPLNEDRALKEAYLASVDIMREYISGVSKILKKTGIIDSKTAMAVLKVMESVSLRLHGAPVQRVEQKNLNLTLSEQAPEKYESIEDIDRKLLELQNSTFEVKPHLPKDIEIEHIKIKEDGDINYET